MLTEDKKLEIEILYRSGLSMTEVSNRTGVPRGTIQHTLDRRGVPRRRRGEAIRAVAEKRVRETLDEDLIRRLAADPRMTYAQACERTGLSESALRKHCHRLEVTWESHQTKYAEIDEDLLRALAEDPEVTVKQAAEELGISVSAVEAALRRLKLKWARRRVATDQQILAMAKDPDVSLLEGARRLGYSSTQGLYRALRRLQVEWSGKGTRPRREVPEKVREYLRKAAPDPRIGMEAAAKHLGLSRTTLKRHVNALELHWVSPPRATPRRIRRIQEEKTRSGAPMRQTERSPGRKTPHTPYATRRGKRAAVTQDAPAIEMTPELLAGTPGFRWYCPDLDLRGWKAGCGRDPVEAAIREGLASVSSRRNQSGEPE